MNTHPNIPPFIFRLGRPQDFKLELPQVLQHYDVIDITHRAELEQAIEQLNIYPQAILLPTQSDSLTFARALQHWSSVPFLIEQAQHDPACWFDVTTQQTHLPVTPSEENPLVEVVLVPPTQVTQPLVEQTSQQDQEEDEEEIQAQSSPSHATLNPKELLNDIFRFSSYEGKEHDNHIRNLLYQAESYKAVYPELKDAPRVQRQGERACQLIAQAKTELRKMGDSPDFEAWLQQLLDNEQSKRVKNTVKSKIKKERQYLVAKRQQVVNKSKPCTVKSPSIDAKHPHPNSLRHLEPHDYWEIVIDESGNEFQSVVEYCNSDAKIGRIVALVVPKGKAKLSTLDQGFHANKEEPDTLDKVINTVLNQPVGVLGLHLKDQLAYTSTNWLSEIYNLLRLVMRLLPLSQGVNNQVDVYIENRGQYTAGVSLSAIRDMLDAELKSVDTERFKQLHLNIQFVAKDGHPYLSYVDTLAHTWSGSSAKQRLKQAKFNGHCFLNPTQDAIERIYATLENKKPLSPEQWYQVLEQLTQEPEHSILHDALHQLGQQCQKDVVLWENYLQEVKYRLEIKQYSSFSLDYILLWLKQYQPEQQSFTPQLELRWLVAKLAADNHLGRVNLEDSERLLSLGQQLQEEIAPEVCHAYLRVAVVGTNNFEFASSKDILDYALTQPINVIGRLNYAKLYSSLGQWYSFTQQYIQANENFEQALNEFNVLSDPKAKADNFQQTTIYRLLNSIDGQLFDGIALHHELEQHYQCQIDEKFLKRLVMTNRKTDRYNHHLLLRSFVAYPQAFQQQIKIYLSLSETWQHEEGHPWNLIEFWRGWLFLQQDQIEQACKQFSFAVTQYAEDTMTLQWIVLVLATVASKFNTDLGNDSLSIQYEILQQTLPHAPHPAYIALQKEKSTDLSVLYPHIAACLPFNFK